MSDKEYKGVWMPKEIVADRKLAPLEKIIWSMAASLPEHLRMADATIAERIGTTPKNVAKILAKMVKKGYLRKSGSHNHRCFHPITPKGGIAIPPKGEVSEIDYPKSSNQLPQKGESITPKGDHREQERTINRENTESAKQSVDKDTQPVDVSDTPQQVVSELWRRYLDLSTGRPFRIKPKVGSLVYDPKTEEQKEYEGE